MLGKFRPFWLLHPIGFLGIAHRWLHPILTIFLLSPRELLAIYSINKQGLAKPFPRLRWAVLSLGDKFPPRRGLRYHLFRRYTWVGVSFATVEEVETGCGRKVFWSYTKFYLYFCGSLGIGLLLQSYIYQFVKM